MKVGSCRCTESPRQQLRYSVQIDELRARIAVSLTDSMTCTRCVMISFHVRAVSPISFQRNHRVETYDQISGAGIREKV
jgi:hypothetical protein